MEQYNLIRIGLSKYGYSHRISKDELLTKYPNSFFAVILEQEKLS